MVKSCGTAFRLISVYGSPYDDGKYDFIFELHNLFIDDHQPTLIGGDFNLVRYQQDKSNGNIKHSWSDKFNAWAEIWSLLEIKMSGRQFSWANNQENLIVSTIDRIFCTAELDANFPLSNSQALPEQAVTTLLFYGTQGLVTLPRVIVVNL